MGWAVNVHVNLRQQLMLRTRCELAAAVDATHTRGGGGWGGVGWGGVGWGGMLTFMRTCGSS